MAMYELSPGQTYTAPRGINFYLLFIAEEEVSGDFVFTIWFNPVSGYGEYTPQVATEETVKIDPEKFHEVDQSVDEPVEET